MKIIDICDKVVFSSFSLLFFLVPLILTPFNYELFEYNKMMLVYGLTTVITGAWLIKMIAKQSLIFRRTPLDLPLAIFLIAQLLSFFFSLDRHVSWFGYYSRFHGGLLSTISYLLLYCALVSNVGKETVIKFLKISLLSALAVSIYGILEHFGIDKDVWVQDVQNRVFSTLGQPNWLAAYLVILLPITTALAISSKNFFIFYFLFFIFYLCLLYTKSRSGLLAFGLTYLVFWLGVFWLNRQSLKSVLRQFFIFYFLFFILSILVGTPWTPKLQSLIARQPIPSPSSLTPDSTAPSLETGGTESGEIRKIVWQGAWEIANRYPLFGTGPETFAFAYYQFKPREHNLTSEWDFLYNKAHNEYLNYAATTGFIGLGSYLLFISAFGWWFIRIYSNRVLIHPNIRMNSKKIRENSEIKLNLEPRNNGIVLVGLFVGWTSILITNFFGFSVVPVALYFWLIPAMAFTLTRNTCNRNSLETRCVLPRTLPKCLSIDTSGIGQKIGIILILFFIFYFLFFIFRFWYADTRFNQAYQLSKASYYKQASPLYQQAISLNPGEPFYRDETSYTKAVLAADAWEHEEATRAAQLANEALFLNRSALKISPFNLNFWKTRTKVFYSLSSFNEKYNEEALESLLTAQKLAPTDAKIAYNLGLLYGRVSNSSMAIKTLEKTIDLKPNYGDARYALALFYHEAGQKDKAIEQLEYILTKISTGSAEAKEKLKEWQ